MPKPVQLVPHLTEAELMAKFRFAPSGVESRRWHLLLLVCQGRSVRGAALGVHMEYQRALELVQRHNASGPEAMVDGRHASGPKGKIAPKALLNEQLRQELVEALSGLAPDGGLWTGPEVARWIEEKTGAKNVNPTRVWKYLQKLGFSSRRPRPRHEKSASEAEREAFKKRSSPTK
jgi:transposase